MKIVIKNSNNNILLKKKEKKNFETVPDTLFQTGFAPCDLQVSYLPIYLTI